MRPSTALMLALLLQGCAMTIVPPAPMSEPKPLGPLPVAEENRPWATLENTQRMRGYVLAREYYDRWSEHGVELHRRVEYGYDYDRAVTLQRVFDLEGRLLAEQELPLVTLAPTAAELDRIIALARAHPQLAPALAESDLFMHGGFAVREAGDPACGERSRCLMVIVSADGGYREVAHAVVDLVTDRVVYVDYRAASGARLRQEFRK